MQARADLTPGQRELLDSGPNRAYGGDTLPQMDGTTLSPRQVARGRAAADAAWKSSEETNPSACAIESGCRRLPRVQAPETATII